MPEYTEDGEALLTIPQINSASFGKPWIEAHNLYMERGPGIFLPLDCRNCTCHKKQLPVYDHWDKDIRTRIF